MSFFLVVFSWGYYVFRFRGVYLFFYVTVNHEQSRPITVDHGAVDHGRSWIITTIIVIFIQINPDRRILFFWKSTQTDVLNNKSTQWSSRSGASFLPKTQLAKSYRRNCADFWKASGVRGLWDTPTTFGKNYFDSSHIISFSTDVVVEDQRQCLNKVGSIIMEHEQFTSSSSALTLYPFFAKTCCPEHRVLSFGSA